MTSEEIRALAVEMDDHRARKKTNQDYPKLPLSVRHSSDALYSMDENAMKHFVSCYSGFKTRLHNYNEGYRRRLNNTPRKV